MTIPKSFELLLCQSLKRPHASMKMSNFERKYSPGYRHKICIGKRKSTSEKGLYRESLNERRSSLSYLSILSDVAEFGSTFRVFKTKKFEGTSNCYTYSPVPRKLYDDLSIPIFLKTVGFMLSRIDLNSTSTLSGNVSPL